jgi:hypothetical protein
VSRITVINSGELSSDDEAKLRRKAEERARRFEEALETTNVDWDIAIPENEFTPEQLGEANQFVRAAGESDLKRILANAAAAEARALGQRTR